MPILRYHPSGTITPSDQPRHLHPTRQYRSTKAYRRLRAQVRAEEGACAECGSTLEPEMDHIVPVAEGGLKFERQNVRRLCKKCNASKGAR